MCLLGCRYYAMQGASVRNKLARLHDRESAQIPSRPPTAISERRHQTKLLFWRTQASIKNVTICQCSDDSSVTIVIGNFLGAGSHKFCSLQFEQCRGYSIGLVRQRVAQSSGGPACTQFALVHPSRAKVGAIVEMPRVSATGCFCELCTGLWHFPCLLQSL